MYYVPRKQVHYKIEFDPMQCGVCTVGSLCSSAFVSGINEHGYSNF